MERDFLGLNGKDAGLFGGSGMPNKAPPLQPLLSFKMPQEEKANSFAAVDQFFASRFRSYSTMDAFETNQKSSSVLASQSLQKSFSLDRQVIQQYAMRAYQSHCADSFGSSRTNPAVYRHPLPIASRRQFFNSYGSPSSPSVMVASPMQQTFGGGTALNTSSFPQRDVMMPSAATTQLTVFYGGTVNVFDNIPVDKAQEIMLLASKSSSSRNTPLQLPSNLAVSSDSDANKTIFQKQNFAPCSGIPSPVSVASLPGTHSRSASITSDDSAGPKPAGPLAPTNQYERQNTNSSPVGATMLRAVPQARKLSLARFLEKRKERVATNAMPYYRENNASKSLLNNLASPSNGDELAHSGESPSTRLEI